MSVATPPIDRDAAPAEATAGPPVSDWIHRLFEWSGRPPWLTGLALFGLLMLISMAVRMGASSSGYGLTQGLGDPYFWTDVLSAVILAYIASTHAMQRRGALRDLADLEPVLRVPATAGEHAQRVVSVGAGALAIAGLVGGFALGVLPIVDSTYWLESRPSLANPILIFLVTRNFATGWLAGHALLTEVHMTRGYACLGTTELECDPLDLAPLEPFARKGQRGALVWLGLSTLLSLYWLVPTAADSNWFILALILTLVTVVFVYPIYGAHSGIVLAKQRELGTLRRELRGAQRAAPSVERDARIAALAALHGTIDGVREWPVDTPALLRFAFFALLGLASWFGSAFVERLLDTAIG